MKAKVKATGKIINVLDYGKNFHPRYWSKTTGYEAEELEMGRPKLTTPAPVTAKRQLQQYHVKWEIELNATSPRQAAKEALSWIKESADCCTFDVTSEKGKTTRINL
jgi:hypothetical protein